LPTAGRSDRSKNQILRDDSHSPKDKAARAAAKGALCLFRDSLSHSRYCVHVTQTIG
jgi:hypothetical protein